MKKNNNHNESNKVTEGCRGCKYLDTDPRVFPPYECWFPRESRKQPMAISLERFRMGCKGRKEGN